MFRAIRAVAPRFGRAMVKEQQKRLREDVVMDGVVLKGFLRSFATEVPLQRKKVAFSKEKNVKADKFVVLDEFQDIWKAYKSQSVGSSGGQSMHTELLNSLTKYDLSTTAKHLQDNEAELFINSLYDYGSESILVSLLSTWSQGKRIAGYAPLTRQETHLVHLAISKVKLEAIIESMPHYLQFLKAMKVLAIDWNIFPLESRLLLLSAIEKYDKDFLSTGEEKPKNTLESTRDFVASAEFLLVQSGPQNLSPTLQAVYVKWLKQALQYNPATFSMRSWLRQATLLQMKKEDLPAGTKVDLILGLSRDIDRLDFTQLIFLTANLGKFGFLYQDLPLSFRNTLFTSLIYRSKHFSLSMISDLMHACSNLEIYRTIDDETLKQFRTHMMNHILEKLFIRRNRLYQDSSSSSSTTLNADDTAKLEKILSEAFDERDLGSLIYNIGKSKWKYFQMSDTLQLAMFKTILSNSPNFSFRTVTSVLAGFAGMNYKWNLLPTDIQTSLMRVLLTNYPTINQPEYTSKTLSYLLSTFTLLNYDWTDNLLLYEKMTQQLTHVLEKESEKDSEDGKLYTLLQSLAESNIRWNSMSDKLRPLLLNASIASLNSCGNANDLSRILKGLADLYLPFSSNNSDIPAVMEANILRVGSTQATPLSTARLVNSLSKLEFSLKNLKPGTRELLVDLTMKAIKADLPWVLEDVMRSIPLLSYDAIDEMTEKEKERFLDLLALIVRRYNRFERSSKRNIADLAAFENEKMADTQQQTFAAFFEWLDTFPSKSLMVILEKADVDSLPEVKTQTQNNQRVSRAVSNILFNLRKRWNDACSKEEDLENVQFHVKHSALKRGLFPMSIAAQWKEQDYLGFIKIPANRPQWQSIRYPQSKRREEFIDYLYQQNHFGTPIWLVKGEDGMKAEIATENIVKKLLSIVNQKTRE